MRCRDFYYELPPELIAQEPAAERGGSRLLDVNARTGTLTDRHFAQFPQLLQKGDLLVFNDTRVVRARLFARKEESGGAVELLLERVLEDDAAAGDETRVPQSRGLFQARASKPLRQDARLLLAGGGRARVLGRDGDLIELEFSEPIFDYLARHGEVPLPPYIKRDRDTLNADSERYQTVFARVDGAVAAPTAGLHFDQRMLDALSAAGIERASVTLHVGAGTFQPVRVDNLDHHQMHRERVEVSAATCAAIAATRARGGRVVAVGTTVVRSLESACQEGVVAPLHGETSIFIRPGYRFQVVDALLTNFHLPESTLMMLVCAFGGMEPMMAAYRHAVRERYRFFSYGDAMFVTPPVSR